MNLPERVVSPAPTFFQKLRNIGLALAAISAANIAAPVALPAIVKTIAGVSTPIFQFTSLRFFGGRSS